MASRRARLRAGEPVRSAVGGRRCAPTALRCSVCEGGCGTRPFGVRVTSLREVSELPRCDARCAGNGARQSSPSRRCAAGNPRRPALLGAAHSLPGPPARSLAGTRSALCEGVGAARASSPRCTGHAAGSMPEACPTPQQKVMRCPAKGWAGRSRSAYEAPRSTGLVAARASAPRDLTRGNCLSAASAARAASFAAGRETEHHRGVGSRSEATASSKRSGLPARPFARADRTTNVRNAPFADLRSFPRFTRRGPREAVGPLKWI